MNYLDNVVDVRDEPVHADFHKHDQRAAYVLPHVRVLIRRQEKQVLRESQTVENGRIALLCSR